MIKYIFTLMALWACSSLQAQDYITIKSASDKLKRQYAEAYDYIANEQWSKGIAEMQALVKKNPKFVNPYILIGDTYRQLKNLDSAIVYFNKALEIAPDYEPKIHYALGQIYLEKKDYTPSVKHLEVYATHKNISPETKKKLARDIESAKFRAENYPKDGQHSVKLINLGDGVNTAMREYFPSITVTSDMLVYTVERPTNNNAMQEDLYFSTFKNGKWQTGQPIPNINTLDNEGAQKISADGKMLVLTVCNRKGDYGSCDIYFSTFNRGQWSTPKNIGAPISSGAWESQPSVSPNGDAIYFTRGSKSGTSGKDLFVSYKQADGTWGVPVELSEINTDFDEVSPCIHPDGQTLYFASNGHAGFGSFDLFMSRKGEDGKFSKPINLGYGINTEANEQDISVSLKGDLAFLTSQREDGFGLLDIYSVELPDFAKPAPVTYVELVVKDAKTKKIIPQAKIQMLNISTEQPFLSAMTDIAGEALICLPMGKDYAVQINKQGYLFHSEQFALTADYASDKPFKLEIFLNPISSTLANNGKTENLSKTADNNEPKAIILKNIFFDSNSAKLKSTSIQELQQLKALLIEQPNMIIQINGHTDSEGDDNANLVLSQNRALSVKNYLEQEGIDPKRLTAKGFGETQPIDSNDTPQGRSNNRRTEFVILSNK